MILLNCYLRGCRNFTVDTVTVYVTSGLLKGNSRFVLTDTETVIALPVDIDLVTRTSL